MKKWTIKDFITLAIFNVVMLICCMIGAMATPLVGYIISPAITGFLITPFMMIMANRINKSGTFFLTSIIFGIFFAAMGMTYYIILYILFSVICEAIVWANNAHQNPIKVTLSTIVFQTAYVLGGVFPLFLFREKYLEALAPMYATSAELDKMIYYFETPSMILLMVVVSAVTVVLGSFIGRSLLTRHVRKAKLV